MRERAESMREMLDVNRRLESFSGFFIVMVVRDDVRCEFGMDN